MFRTFDGENWVTQNSGTNVELYGVYFVDSTNGWAVGDKGTILHTNNGGLATVQSQKIFDSLIVSVIPNPSKGFVTVHNASANILHVTVSSILGEVVLELKNPKASEFTLDLSKFPPGIYFARCEFAGEVVPRKIVKE